MTQAPPSTTESAPARRTVWPSALGIIMAILGAAALFGYGCCVMGFSAAMPWVIEFLEPMAKTDPNVRGQIAQFQVMADWRYALIASNLTSGALGGLLIAAGVQLYKRRASSRRLSLAWCWSKLIFIFPATALGGYINFAGANAYSAAMEDSPHMPAGMIEMVGWFGLIGVVMTVLWQVALPVFLLIWMARPAVREEMGEWR